MQIKSQVAGAAEADISLTCGTILTHIRREARERSGYVRPGETSIHERSWGRNQIPPWLPRRRLTTLGAAGSILVGKADRSLNPIPLRAQRVGTGGTPPAKKANELLLTPHGRHRSGP